MACAETRHLPAAGFANVNVDLEALVAAPQVAIPYITSPSDQECGLVLGFEAGNISGSLLVPGR